MSDSDHDGAGSSVSEVLEQRRDASAAAAVDVSQETICAASFDPVTFTSQIAERLLLDAGVPPAVVRGAYGEESWAPHSPQTSSEPKVRGPQLAHQLAATFREAAARMIDLEASSVADLHKVEGESRAIEAREKLHLGMVNAALEQTAVRLRDFEATLRDAVAATVGVDRRLSQASARASRGRVVEELLQNFESFAQCSVMTLSPLLAEMSRVRAVIRARLTAFWGGPGNATLTVATPAGAYFGPLPDPVAKQPEVEEALDTETELAAQTKLGRQFMSREQTEGAVAWMQRLHALAKDMPADARVNSAPTELYLNWLQKELIAELFHLQKCFGLLYDARPALATSHPHGKLLLKSMELAARLHHTLIESMDDLVEVMVDSTVESINEVLAEDLSLTPLPPQPPVSEPAPQTAMAFFSHTSSNELAEAFDFILERLERQALVFEILFSGARGAQTRLFGAVMDRCVRKLVSTALAASDRLKVTALQAEARLSPRSKRRAQNRINDAVSFHFTTLNALFVLTSKLLERVAAKLGKPARDAMTPFMDSLFQDRVAYISQAVELELLRRTIAHAETNYVRDLAVHPDAAFDVRPAHLQKAREILDAVHAGALRVKSLAPPDACPAAVEGLFECCITRMASFLEQELKKTCDGLKQSASGWSKLVKNPESFYTAPQPNEAHIAAARVLQWVTSTVAQMLELISRHCVTIATGSIAGTVEAMLSDALEGCTALAEVIVQFICQAVVVRSLAVVMHLQEKSDFKPKEVSVSAKMGNTAAAAATGSPSGRPTRACTLCCSYLRTQLSELQSFLRETSAASTAASDSYGGIASSGDTSLTSPLPAFHVRTPSMDLPVASTPHHRRTNSQTLQDTAGSGTLFSFLDMRHRATTPTRIIGVALFKGLFAHLTSFTVNDAGALVYKRDTTCYREALQVLCEGAAGANDAGVVASLFDLLKETSNLLMVPLDNIATVKESGNLRLLPPEEKQRVLRMRADLKDAFRMIGSK